MNRAIYKYTLRLAAFQALLLPVGARFLSLQLQDGLVRLWALVNPDTAHPLEEVEIVIEGTGSEHSEEHSLHLGTVVSGGYVWHYFARPHQLAKA